MIFDDVKPCFLANFMQAALEIGRVADFDEIVAKQNDINHSDNRARATTLDGLFCKRITVGFANGRQHFMINPTLKFAGFRFAAGEDETIKPGLIDNVDFALLAPYVQNRVGHYAAFGDFALFVVVETLKNVRRIFEFENAAGIGGDEPRLTANHDDTHFAELLVLEQLILIFYNAYSFQRDNKILTNAGCFARIQDESS